MLRTHDLASRRTHSTLTQTTIAALNSVPARQEALREPKFLHNLLTARPKRPPRRRSKRLTVPGARVPTCSIHVAMSPLRGVPHERFPRRMSLSRRTAARLAERYTRPLCYNRGDHREFRPSRVPAQVRRRQKETPSVLQRSVCSGGGVPRRNKTDGLRTTAQQQGIVYGAALRCETIIYPPAWHVRRDDARSATQAFRASKPSFVPYPAVYGTEVY